MYDLEYREEIEIRYRTVTKTYVVVDLLGVDLGVGVTADDQIYNTMQQLIG